MNAHRLTRICAAAALCLLALGEASAAGPYALIAGRRDPAVTVVDLAKALEAGNNGTTNAVISRVRVSPDVDTNGDGVVDAPASGLPSNLVIPKGGRYAYVVNHGGITATPAQVAAFQHGWPGTVTVLDLKKALDPANNSTLNAVVSWVPTGGFGAVGLAVMADQKTALAPHSEGPGKEDGGRDLNVIDLTTGAVLQRVPLAMGNGGAVPQSLGKSCAGLMNNPETAPKVLPDPDVGCFPDSNTIVVSNLKGGYAFIANGGTDDVSVVELKKLLAGDLKAEVSRIATGVGPWGQAITTNGDLVAVGNRESAETGIEGNTVSLIDVSKAIDGRPDAVAATLMVGTDSSAVATRPFGMAFTPNGKRLLVANFRTNSLSIVDVQKALARSAGAEVARISLPRPDGGPGRPRGVAVTDDGKYATVSGGAANATGGGALWVVDVEAAAVVSTVMGVGNEPYIVQITNGAGQ
jgi:DNA-binding beta-propeller fold protein YncE